MKTNYTRKSLIVKISRVYQYISPVFTPFDRFISLFFKNPSTYKTPLLVILAPPRSGSTLLYQILCNAFENFHLTNLWNLLYATPLLGGFISIFFCRKYTSQYKSYHGFVPGICGEAEGLKFWSFWTGQNLYEQTSYSKTKNFLKLYKIINKIGFKLKRPFITGYLPHVFCINELSKSFGPKIIFIHLYRNLVANAYSIYKSSPDKWFSIKPAEISIQANRFTQIAQQLIFIHKKILDNTSKNNTIRVSYEEITTKPREWVYKIFLFAQQKNIKLKIKNINLIPEKFNTSTVNFSNEETRSLEKSIKKEIALLNSKYYEFFNKII